jgi:hypothetical protein
MADSDNQIQVAISVDGSEAETGAQQAADDIKDASGEITESLEETAEASESLSSQISESFARMGEAARDSAKETKENLESIAGAIKTVQSTLSLIGEVAVLGFIGDSLKEAVESVGEYGEAIQQASERTGESTDEIQKFAYAARTVGVGTGEANRSLIMLARRMAEAEQGSEQAKASFEAVGVSMEDIKNESMDEVLAKIATAFQSHADGANKAALAQQLLGRAGAEMIPLLNEGSEGLEEMGKRADEVGAVINAQAIAAMDHLGEDLHQLGADTDAASMSFKAQFVPALDDAVKAIDTFITSSSSGKEVLNDMAEAIKGVVAIVLTVVTGFEQLGDVINGVSTSAHDLGALDFAGVARDWSTAMQRTKADGDAYTASLERMYGAASKMQDLASGAGAGSGIEDKPKFTLPVTQGQSGAKDQFAQANAEAQAELAMLKQKILEENQENESAYKAGEISLSEYYAERLSITQQNLQKEIAVKQQELSQTETLASASKTDQERQGMIVKEIALKGQLAVLNEQLSYSAVQGANEELAAQDALDNQLLQMSVNLNNSMAEQAKKMADSSAQDQFKAKSISMQQLVQLEIQNENQLYSVQMAGLQKRLSDTANLTIAQRQQLNDQITELDQQHNDQLISLQQQAAQDQAKPQQEMIQDIQDDFANFFDSVTEGTKTLKNAFLQLATDIQKQLTQSLSQQLVKNLLGAGTSGGGGLNSIVGSLFGMNGVGQATPNGQNSGTNTNPGGLMNALAGLFGQAMGGLGGSGGSSMMGGYSSLFGSGAGSSGAEAGSFGFTTGLEGTGEAVADGAASDAGSTGLSTLMGIAAYAKGTNYVPETGIALIHKGEAVVPAAYNNSGGSRNMSARVQNNFYMPKNYDLRTQNQIAYSAGASIQSAMRRNG